ncbi:signal peptidase I [Enterococcus sp. LJL120]
MNWIKNNIRDILWLVIVVVVVFAARAFLFTPVIVIGESMNPTLQDGEWLFSLKVGGINRFNIVALDAPDEGHEGEEYIKRIIGLPGDTITYQADILYVNGEAVDEPYLDEYKSELAYGEQLTEDFAEITVPEGYYFVMGDNRQNSKDSRYFGPIPESSITANAKFAMWPFDRFGELNIPEDTTASSN